jgi:predicted NUDIX family NTP pyrophosphohydrolase
MTARVSAGILLYRLRDGGPELLLAHPGGPLFARRDEGAWTIPKGAPDGEADLLLVALREFGEETGHDIPSIATDPDRDPIPLGTVVQRSGKTVHAWAIEGDLDPAAASSNTFEMEWPPRTGQVRRWPEIDRLGWFGPEEARRKANRSQAAFVDRLVAVLRETAQPG